MSAVFWNDFNGATPFAHLAKKTDKGIIQPSMEEKPQTIPKVQNLVVARFRDGKMIRGITRDFGPQKKVFHVSTIERHGRTTVDGKVFEISLSELKAVFFVKSLEGRQDPLSLKGLMEEKLEAPGLMKVRITFFDGEVLVGTTQGYAPEREGFFIVPLERDSNNLRIFVISSSVKKVETWK
jgi:Family of unknown function (DUF6982)